MDARLDVYRILGLGDGDTHVIRNVGGVITADEIGSLAIRQPSRYQAVLSDPPDRHARGRDVKARGKIKNMKGPKAATSIAPRSNRSKAGSAPRRTVTAQP
jgi:hypothetical protein